MSENVKPDLNLEMVPAIDLYKTFGDLLNIVDFYITLDTKRHDGQITAEEFADQLAHFMLPVAVLGMNLLIEAGPSLDSYIRESKEMLDSLRQDMVGLTN